MPSPNHRSRSSNTSLSLSNAAALRRGDLKISDPIPFDSDFRRQADPLSANMDSFPVLAKQQDSTWPRKSTPPKGHGRNASLGYADQGDLLTRSSVGPSLVPSSMSTAPSKASLIQKKNSGFRATLKRMFGSKRRRSSFNDSRKEFHRSDPGNLTSITEKQADARVARIPSQATGNITRASALGSHCPNALINQLPRSSSERDMFTSPRRRRRNTLPSLILTDQEAQILAGSKDDLAARVWKQVDPNDYYLKRRSRSADALNDLIGGEEIVANPTRDREDEIAYWRTSVLQNPPPELRTLPYDDENYRQQPTTSASDRQGVLPIQTFDFGLPQPDAEAATLDQRVCTLEIKLFDFEYAIAKLQGNDMPKPLLYPKPPKRRSIHELFPQNSTTSTLTTSSSAHELTTFLSSPDASPMPSTESDDHFSPNRSSKATTIRPLTAQRGSSQRSGAPSPSSARLSPNQFDKLMDLMKEEQDARRRLESQVSDIQRELEALRTPVYAEIRPLAYPTSNPGSFHDNQGRRALHRTPAFQLGKVPQETSRFSMSDADSDTDDGCQDVYETPRENKHTFEPQTGSPLVGVY